MAHPAFYQFMSVNIYEYYQNTCRSQHWQLLMDGGYQFILGYVWISEGLCHYVCIGITG